MVDGANQEGEDVGPMLHKFLLTSKLVIRPCNISSKIVTFVTELLATVNNLQGFPAAGAALGMAVEFI